MVDGLNPFVATVLLAVGALLPIVDPLGNAPLFLAMTSGSTPADRARLAKAVAINSFMLLAASALVGAYVLDFFGLSVPAVQVAGGAVLCSIGWKLLHGPIATPIESDAPDISDEALRQRAFYPLTMPLTVGPGSISVALTLGANPSPGYRSLVVTALAHALGILIVSLAVLLCYRYAHRMMDRLGPVMSVVLVRLSAFILLCIGVQIGWNGLHDLLSTVGRTP